MKPEAKHDPNTVAIVVTTHYPTWRDEPVTNITNTVQVRGSLGVEFIQNANEAGYQVVVVDSGNSSPAFLEQLPSRTHLVKSDRPNLAWQKRLGIIAASAIGGVTIIHRNEPEKVDYIQYLPAFCQPIERDEADIVIGNRRDEEFRASYPDYGYESEMQFTRTYLHMLEKAGILPEGVYFDLYSGPITFLNNPEVVEGFLARFRYTGSPESYARRHLEQDGWSHTQIFGALIGLHRGLRVTSVEVPFRYAPTQKENEMHPDLIEQFKQKRALQRIGGLNLGVLLIDYLLNCPTNQFELE